MSLKRTAKQSILPTVQPSPKRRRLNTSLPPLSNTQESITSAIKPRTTSHPSYHDYANKLIRKMNFADTHKHSFVSSLDMISYLRGHKSCVNTICWEKSGRHLCSGSDDETVRIWDVFALEYNGKTPKMLCILRGHLSNVFTSKFMYTSSVFGINNIVASGGNDADIHIYDINHSPYTFKNRNTLCTTAQSMFIKPIHSYHHHSRKVLKISVHPCLPFELISCSADGTIRHFDLRQKYKQHKFSSSSQDIITQGFGGGPRTNRGRFRESLLYDFNTFNKHWQVYSVDINPIKTTEIVTCCGDGFIRIFDLRKHSNGAYNKAAFTLNNTLNNGINSLSKYNRNNAISSFYNFRMKFPQHCHPTDCIYNSDGSEILTTHIHDAAYLYINPTTISTQYDNDYPANDIEDKIKEFIEDDESEYEEEEDDIDEEDQDEDVGNDDVIEFADMLNFAVYSRISADRRHSSAEAVHILLDNDLLDYVETLVDRRKEVLRTNGAEHNFQHILFDLVSAQEAKLKEKKDTPMDEKNDDDLINIRSMKWNTNGIINKVKRDKKNMLLPPIDSNISIINHYHNEYYKEYDNGMRIAEEPCLHDLSESVYYFGRYIGHIHCETIKEIAFFSDNYIITGSDDRKIYIYNRLNGDIVNILDNKTNIVNNIAVHPSLPIFVSSGLDSHITMWGPKGWNNNTNNDEEVDNQNRDRKCTKQIMDNIFHLRHRAGFDIL